MDEKYYEKMYQANVKLVDENSTLKEYTKSLERRIDKAIEYINEMCLSSDGYASYGDDLRPEHIIEILKGDSYEQDNSKWENM